LDIDSFEGAQSARLVDYGKWLCGTFERENAQHFEDAMPLLISFLDKFREHLEEISSELGVTDPINGSVVVEG